MLTIGHFVTWVPCEVFAVAFLVFVLGTRMRIGARIGWTVVLAICCAKFWLFGAFGGNRCNPVLPDWVILILNLMFSWAAGIAVMGLVWWHRRTRVWAVPVLAAVLAAIGNWNGLCLPEVREVRLSYPNLPLELEGYRIVQVSDLHASTAMRRWRTEFIVKMVNALDADLICITGDLVDGEPEVAAEFVEPIRNLRAKDGVWAITGNHEYFYSVEKWRKRYNEWGIRFLENACVFPRKSLALGGVNDFQVCRGKFPKEWRPDVAAAFASATNGEFRVLLQHQPKDARENIVHHNVDLQLSGHTHGGFMPGISTIISRASNGFIRGLYPICGKFLYVSPGCGQCAWLPVRFLDNSEITVVVLRQSANR